MTPRSKKRLLNIARIVACVAALVIVVNGVTLRDHITLKGGAELRGGVTETEAGILLVPADGDEITIDIEDVAVDGQGNLEIRYGLITAWTRSLKWLLGVAVAIYFVVVFPQALRFRWLLRTQSIHVGYWDCVKLSFAGNFLNFATPMGSNLGDVFKAYFVSQHTDRKTEAVATVVLDRVLGLGGLLFVVVLITLISGGESRLAPFRPYMLGVFLAGILAVVVYFSPALRKRLPAKWLDRLPMREHLVRIDEAAHKLAAAKMTVVGAIVLTVILQGTAISAYFVVAIAMGMDAHAANALEYYAYFYTGILIQALPGPPQGLGTVELSYRYFLAPFGSPSQIVCMAFAIRVVVLACSLPGLFITLTGSHRPSTLRNGLSSLDPPEPERALPAREMARS